MLHLGKHLVIFHLSNRRDLGAALPVFLPFFIKAALSAFPPPTQHPVIQLLVEVRCVRPDERREVQGVGPRRVAEVGHVEEAGPPPCGEEDLLLVRGVALCQEPLDQDERLERDGPVPGLVEALRQGVDARAYGRAGVACQADDLLDVLLLRREIVVPGRLHYRDFQVGVRAPAGTDLRQADAGLVFDSSKGSPQLA